MPPPHVDNSEYHWHRIRNKVGLPGSRIHDLRHTVASQAVMAGGILLPVGRLLGHSRRLTTAGYVHLANAHLVMAAEKIGRIVEEAMATARKNRFGVSTQPCPESVAPISVVDN